MFRRWLLIYVENLTIDQQLHLDKNRIKTTASGIRFMTSCFEKTFNRKWTASRGAEQFFESLNPTLG